MSEPEIHSFQQGASRNPRELRRLDCEQVGRKEFRVELKILEQSFTCGEYGLLFLFDRVRAVLRTFAVRQSSNK